VNGRLLLQTLRWQRTRLLIVILAAFGWGMLGPVFYTAFSDVVGQLAQSGPLMERLTNFGSGSLFNLPDAFTLGMQHPLALAMVGVFAVGATSTAVAGERQRGTLEILLARPISRVGLYASIAVALMVPVLLVMSAIMGGFALSAALLGVADELEPAQMPLVVLNGFLLWAAFATFGLAASVTFDRAAPAIALSLAYLIVNYFLEILGSLWTEVAWSQEYSLFHHFQPGDILRGDAAPLDFVIVGLAALIPVVYAVIVFPRRDLAAPA